MQAQYIAMFKNEGIKVLFLPYAIDSHFISFVEYKNSEYKFKRIDSSVEDTIDKEAEKDDSIAEIFKKAIGDENMVVECAPLKNTSLPAIINVSEESRRMQEMSAVMGINMPPVPEEKKLILNTSSPIVQKIKENKDEEKAKLICNYINDLAMLAHKPLTSAQMSAFLERSNEILTKLG